MNNQENSNSIILLDYYSGAYGPTIRIDIMSLENLRKMKNLFVQLAKSTNYEINLLELENIKVKGINKFILQSISLDKKYDRFGTKNLTLTKHNNNEIIFQWKLSPCNWETTVCLVQRLLDVKTPGHQYLTKEGIDDALVEFTFLERDQFKWD